MQPEPSQRSSHSIDAAVEARQERTSSSVRPLSIPSLSSKLPQKRSSTDYVLHSAKDAEQSSPSLAAHYIPDKLVTTPTSWGAEARRQSRLAVGGLGAAAGRRSSAARSRNGSSGRIAAVDGMHSQTDHKAPASVSAIDLQAGRGSLTTVPRSRKQGAGRTAWGANGGGHAALGAGGYESDEGVELEQTGDSTSLAEDRQFEAKPSRLYLGVASPDPVSTAANSGGRRSSNSDEISPMPRDQRRSMLTRLFGVSMPRQKGKWNQFKWSLFAANFVLTCYTIAGFIAILLTWANYFPNSNVLRVVNRAEVVLGTVAMCLCLITCIVGWAGILLNNRAFLAVYAAMLWVALAFIVAPGYVAYKRRTFNLSGKMNHLWSRSLTLDQRRLVQTVLRCCGYYSPFIEAAADGNRCYARSALPGCKGPLIDFERHALLNVYVIAFSLVPAHLACLVTTMLCANHVTYRFGKGITPSRYRVDDRTLSMAYQRSALNMTIANKTSHVLYVDQSPLDEPKPPFWHEPSSSKSR